MLGCRMTSRGWLLLLLRQPGVEEGRQGGWLMRWACQGMCWRMSMLLLQATPHGVQGGLCYCRLWWALCCIAGMRLYLLAG